MTIFRLFTRIFAVGLLAALGANCRAADVPSVADSRHMSQLGPGDVVTIQVYGQPDVPNVYVGDDGKISVPLVGDVKVAGMSPVEAAGKVTTALKDGGFFVDPHVAIVVTQQSSQLVSVVGEVQTVGRYPINPRTTIVDLLALAGGLKITASDVGYIQRIDDSGHVNRYAVKLTGLTDLKDVLPTATLLGGDSLIVPRAEHCFVLGEVTTPGTYPIEPGMTVIQAIARAGGINARGSERRIELKRLVKNGQYQVISVKPGDPVQADDMIRVKESIF
jgi:polysaccharide export outer membrane protein